MISANNGYGPQILRVLRPTNPAPGVAHNFLFVLPVEAGLGRVLATAFRRPSGRCLESIQSHRLEPSFVTEPWFEE